MVHYGIMEKIIRMLRHSFTQPCSLTVRYSLSEVLDSRRLPCFRDEVADSMFEHVGPFLHAFLN